MPRLVLLSAPRRLGRRLGARRRAASPAGTRIPAGRRRRRLRRFALAELPAQDFLGQHVFEIAFDGAPQLARAVLLVEALGHQEIERRRLHGQPDFARLEARRHLADLDFQDRAHIFLLQLAETMTSSTRFSSSVRKLCLAASSICSRSVA
jgi:hypothetical protein